MTAGTLEHIIDHPCSPACAKLYPRFANQTLSDELVIPHLTSLIQTYLETMSSIGAETWIMHGTLLAWWWNQKVEMS